MTSNNWWDTNYTYIWIFNTGRGFSAFIRLPHNVGIFYDLGCSEDFSPTDFVLNNIVGSLNRYNNCPIAQCVLSHPHADHIQEIDAILKSNGTRTDLHPALLTCPNDHEDEEHKIDIRRIKRDDNKELIEKYKECYKDRHPPLQTLQVQENNVIRADNVEYGIYYLNPERVGEIYPSDDQMYGNGLSIVLYLRHGNQSILFSGDVTPDVFKEVLVGNYHTQKRYTYFDKCPPGLPPDFYIVTSRQPTLKSLLGNRGLSILVAPHHGLESCFCPDMYSVIKENKTGLNVISEKRHLSDKDGIVAWQYQSAEYTIGQKIDIEGVIENRYSVSTRDGHHILIVFKGTNALPHVFLRKDPSDLLNIVP